MLLFLDYMLLLFHSLLIFFNLFGWALQKTRKANLILLSLTAFSWIILGIWYGIGYCPCTDWHWNIKKELGETGLPASYIKYYADLLTGMDTNAVFIDWLTGLSFGGAFIISIILNFRDKRNHNRTLK